MPSQHLIYSVKLTNSPAPLVQLRTIIDFVNSSSRRRSLCRETRRPLHGVLINYRRVVVVVGTMKQLIWQHCHRAMHHLRDDLGPGWLHLSSVHIRLITNHQSANCELSWISRARGLVMGTSRSSPEWNRVRAIDIGTTKHRHDTRDDNRASGEDGEH